MEKKKGVFLSCSGSTLFIVLMVLKLTGVIGWSWWWVTAPLWGPAAVLWGGVVVLWCAVALITWLTSRK